MQILFQEQTAMLKLSKISFSVLDQEYLVYFYNRPIV